MDAGAHHALNVGGRSSMRSLVLCVALAGCGGMTASQTDAGPIDMLCANGSAAGLDCTFENGACHCVPADLAPIDLAPHPDLVTCFHINSLCTAEPCCGGLTCGTVTAGQPLRCCLAPGSTCSVGEPCCLGNGITAGCIGGKCCYTTNGDGGAKTFCNS